MRLGDGVRLLRLHLRPQRRALWWLAGWSALEGVPAFLSGLIIAIAIDRGFLAGRPLVGFGWLAGLAGLWAVGAFGTRQVYPWLASTVEPLRDALVTALVTAAVGTGSAGSAGSAGADGATVSQATVQVETVRGLVSALLRSIRQFVTSAIAAVGGLVVLSPLLALVVGGFVLLALLVFAVLLRVLVTRYRTVVLAEERVTALAAPVVNGMRDVVVAAGERRAAREVGVAIEAEAAGSRALARARALRLPVLTLGAHVPLLALLALSPWLLGEGHLTVGQLAGGVVYLSTGLQPAIQLLVNAGGTIVVNLAVVLGRLAEVCAEPPAGPTVPLRPRPRPLGRDLTLTGVSFAYSPHAEPVVRDLTLEIPDGLHLAVVGPSGVGKSTLANLLARLVVPQRGELHLGGRPLGEVDEARLRRTVALIPQEAYVFAGTLRENLTYLRPEAGDDEVLAAVAAVGLQETVDRLGGLDGAIEPGGGSLSPGERQLIALARTYLSPAGIVILDEGTCHLDPVAEARAEEAFAQRPGTLIVIAHRISSARRADRVLVLDGAEPVLGTHDELLRTSRLYAELVGHWDSPPVPARPPGWRPSPVPRTPAPATAPWRPSPVPRTPSAIPAPCPAPSAVVVPEQAAPPPEPEVRTDERDLELARLRRENERLAEQLATARAVIETQGQLCRLLEQLVTGGSDAPRTTGLRPDEPHDHGGVAVDGTR
jgi:ABC-type multidrug transport system fused ATPase/permease subunit